MSAEASLDLVHDLRQKAELIAESAAAVARIIEDAAAPSNGELVGYVVLTPDRHTGAWDLNWDGMLHTERAKADASAKQASGAGWRAQVAEIRTVGPEIPPDENVRGYLWDEP